MPLQRTTRLTKLLLGACCAFAAGLAHPQPRDFTVLDTQVKALMQEQGVVGMALAVIEGGQVVYVASYGQRNAEKKLPLTQDTVMYGASLTKAAFAYWVLQLRDQGLLGLDTPVTELLPQPLPEYEAYADLAADARWKQLTPRILLTHSAGFANFRWLETDKKLRFHADPGSRYLYSGEGINLLQFIVERRTGLDTGGEMQARIFTPFGMPNTSMRWQARFSENYAEGYDLTGTLIPHSRRGRARAAGSMDTTIADQARLWAAIVRGDGLSAAGRAELVKPGLAITSKHQFPTLAANTEPRNAEVALAAGLGVVTFRDTSGPAWFKGGHDDGTANMVLCLETGKRCVVLLSNDVRAERIYPRMAELVLGKTRMPWSWEYSDYKP
ncbi:MAG: beta-lactamase family protein [Rhodoferax sp.]|nr:beta-lactamase family protein [Rhodoferax sp.]